MHKFVLIAHSDVFNAIFQHKDSVENIQSHMKITDFTSEVVNQMLEFLYFGELPEQMSNENLMELLKIAEKYHLEMLKSVVEENLVSRFLYYYYQKNLLILL